MQVKSIAECSPTGAFCNSFGLHLVIIVLENIFLCLRLSDRLKQVLLYLLLIFIQTVFLTIQCAVKLYYCNCVAVKSGVFNNKSKCMEQT